MGIRSQRRPVEQELYVQRERQHRGRGLVLEELWRPRAGRILVLASDRTKPRSDKAGRQQETQRARALRHVGQRKAVVLGLARRIADPCKRSARQFKRFWPGVE